MRDPQSPKPRTLPRRALSFAVVVVLAVSLLVPPVPSSGITFVDPANLAQNTLTAIRTAEAILQRIEMIRHQIAQIEHMVTNLKDLESPALREILSHLRRVLSEMEERTEGLLFSHRDLDRRFAEIYPQGEPAEDLLTEDRRRLKTTLETARAALLATRIQGEDLLRSQTTLASMKGDALGTEGNLQVLQSAALLEAHTAEEVAKLTQQQLVLTNLLAVMVSEVVSARSRAEETFRQAVADSYVGVPDYAAAEPLPVIPAHFRP